MLSRTYLLQAEMTAASKLAALVESDDDKIALSASK